VQIVTIPTYVLDRTDTRFLVAVAILCQTVPTALFTLIGGAWADRFGRRRILWATVATMALAATGLLPTVIGLASPFEGGADEVLPDFWELVVLAAGCGLVAYGAVDHAPGPAYLGVANLLAFIVSAGLSEDETLYFWPGVLLAAGIGVMIAGLRPRAPLPPEPDAYTTDRVPLANRAGEDEPVLRVRDDSPPS
jgi:MFS family permease